MDNKPLLSVVVVSKDKEIPGSGFFEVACNLELYSGEKNEDSKRGFFLDELRKTYEFWNSK